MSLLEWIITAIVGAAITAAVATVVIALLTLNDVLNWFSQRKSLAVGDKDLMAVTIKKAMDNGNVNVVQGVFSKNQKKLVESRSIQAKELDPQLAARHRYHDVVEYASYEY